MSIQRITADKAKAKSLFITAKSFIQSVEPITNSAEASFLINTEYDILHALCGAILAYDGEKVSGKDHHKILIARICEKYNLTQGETHLLEEVRKIRNDINYYGQKDKEILEDFYKRNKNNLEKVRQNLLEIMQKKVSS